MQYLFDDGELISPRRLTFENVVARAFASHRRAPATELATIADRRLGLVRLTRVSPVRSSSAIRDTGT